MPLKNAPRRGHTGSKRFASLNKLPRYTVAELTTLAGAEPDQLVICSNGNAGAECLAIYSGGGWKRIVFGANVSAT